VYIQMLINMQCLVIGYSLVSITLSKKLLLYRSYEKATIMMFNINPNFGIILKLIQVF